MDRNRVTAYEIVKEENLGDIRSTGYLQRQKKTGARVMLIENDDENKCFRQGGKGHTLSASGHGDQEMYRQHLDVMRDQRDI